jgi:hypothetical protein
MSCALVCGTPSSDASIRLPCTWTPACRRTMPSMRINMFAIDRFESNLATAFNQRLYQITEWLLAGHGLPPDQDSLCNPVQEKCTIYICLPCRRQGGASSKVCRPDQRLALQPCPRSACSASTPSTTRRCSTTPSAAQTKTALQPSRRSAQLRPADDKVALNDTAVPPPQ